MGVLNGIDICFVNEIFALGRLRTISEIVAVVIHDGNWSLSLKSKLFEMSCFELICWMLVNSCYALPSLTGLDLYDDIHLASASVIKLRVLWRLSAI